MKTVRKKTERQKRRKRKERRMSGSGREEDNENGKHERKLLEVLITIHGEKIVASSILGSRDIKE